MTQKGDQFFIKLPSIKAMEGLMMMNGRTLCNGLTPKFARLEVKMELEEIFSWVAMDLKAQERSSTIAKVSRAWPTVEEARNKPKKFAYEVNSSDPSRAASAASPNANSGGPRPPSPRVDRSDPPLQPTHSTSSSQYGADPSQQGKGGGSFNQTAKGKGKGGKGKGFGKGKGDGKGKGSPNNDWRGGRGSQDNGVRGRSRSPSSGCFNCGQEGHLRKDCKSAPRARSRSPNSNACLACGELGHWKNECPKMSSPGGDNRQ